MRSRTNAIRRPLGDQTAPPSLNLVRDRRGTCRIRRACPPVMLRRCQARGRATGWREHRRGATPATSTPGGCERSGTSPRMRHCESRPAGGAFRSERPSARCRRLALRGGPPVAWRRHVGDPTAVGGPARAEGTGRAEARIALTVERRDRDAAVASVVRASPTESTIRRPSGANEAPCAQSLCQHVRRRRKRNQTPVRAIRVRRREQSIEKARRSPGRSTRCSRRRAGLRPATVQAGGPPAQSDRRRTSAASTADDPYRPPHRGEPTAATANHLRCTRSGRCDPETRRSPAKGRPSTPRRRRTPRLRARVPPTCAPTAQHEHHPVRRLSHTARRLSDIPSRSGSGQGSWFVRSRRTEPAQYSHPQRRRTRIHAMTSNGTTTTTMMITGHMGASLFHAIDRTTGDVRVKPRWLGCRRLIGRAFSALLLLLGARAPAGGHCVVQERRVATRSRLPSGSTRSHSRPASPFHGRESRTRRTRRRCP